MSIKFSEKIKRTATEVYQPMPMAFGDATMRKASTIINDQLVDQVHDLP